MDLTNEELLGHLKNSGDNIYGNLLYLMFLLPLFGSGNPAYVVALFFLFYNFSQLKFKPEDIFFLVVIVLWFFVKCQQTQIQAATILLRYYFGFYIFYLFFNNVETKFKADKLLTIISIAVIIEAILINTIIKPEWLPNFPKSDVNGDFAFETKILGFYQRPYSIGTNSTITSTLLMVLLFYNHVINKHINIKLPITVSVISILAVILLGSGTGYVLLILYFIYLINPFKNSFYTSFTIVVLFVIYYLIFIINIGSVDGLEKISSIYFDFLYEYKITQIVDVKRVISADANQLFFGQQFDDAADLVIWSDFAWNNLLLCTGLIGFIWTFLVLAVKTNRYNIIPLLIFIIGAVHYGAMFSLPGQLLVGYFMSSKFKFMMKEGIAMKDKKLEVQAI